MTDTGSHDVDWTELLTFVSPNPDIEVEPWALGAGERKVENFTPPWARQFTAYGQ